VLHLKNFFDTMQSPKRGTLIDIRSFFFLIFSGLPENDCYRKKEHFCSLTYGSFNLVFQKKP